MGIEMTQVTDATTVTYNRIHLVKLEISQHHQLTDATQSIYDVSITYRYYGTDTNGIRHYKGVGQYMIKDFIPVAYAEAANGDPMLLQTFGMVQQAVAKMIKMHTGVETVTY